MFTKLTVCIAALTSLACAALAQQKPVTKPVAAPKAASAVAKKAEPKKAATPKVLTGPIMLNKATAGELELLPGVGAAIAERIVKLRTEMGKFTELSQLLQVKGIGEKKLEKLRPHLKLD